MNENKFCFNKTVFVIITLIASVGIFIFAANQLAQQKNL